MTVVLAFWMPFVLLLGLEDSPAQLRTSAFQSGEELYYEIKYLFAKGADAWFKTTDTIYQGKRCFHHNIGGKTTGMVGLIYPLLDQYYAISSPTSGLPFRAVRNVHEQSYRDLKIDQYDRTARADSALVVRETGDTVVLPQGTLDIVSLFYHFRTILPRYKLQKGMTFDLPLYFDAEFFPMKIRYEGREKIKTQFGRVWCHKFVPLVKQGDLFEAQDALHVWLTADSNYVPMRVQFKLFLGSMYCDLVKYRRLRSSIQVEK